MRYMDFLLISFREEDLLTSGADYIYVYKPHRRKTEDRARNRKGGENRNTLFTIPKEKFRSR